MCWNGHREARATSAQNACNNGLFVYTNTYTRYGWEGLGDLGMGCQWLAGLVSRVCPIWMGGAGVWGWVANG